MTPPKHPATPTLKERIKENLIAYNTQVELMLLARGINHREFQIATMIFLLFIALIATGLTLLFIHPW